MQRDLKVLTRDQLEGYAQRLLAIRLTHTEGTLEHAEATLELDSVRREMRARRTLGVTK